MNVTINYEQGTMTVDNKTVSMALPASPYRLAAWTSKGQGKAETSDGKQADPGPLTDYMDLLIVHSEALDQIRAQEAAAKEDSEAAALAHQEQVNIIKQVVNSIGELETLLDNFESLDDKARQDLLRKILTNQIALLKVVTKIV